jgi:uncharacterized protein (TIGR02284 family)
VFLVQQKEFNMSQFSDTPREADFRSDASSMGAGDLERDGVIEQLNSLLRGEISAAETYAMAIGKVQESDRSRFADVQTLRDMQEEHGRACQSLRERIRALGGEASDSSGAWGAFAKTVEGAATLFGDKATLKALKEGEQHGLKDYQEALDDVDSATASMIENDFIPAQHRHINMLDRLMGSSMTA